MVKEENQKTFSRVGFLYIRRTVLCLIHTIFRKNIKDFPYSTWRDSVQLVEKH